MRLSEELSMISQPPNHKLGGQWGAPQILCRLSQCSVLGPLASHPSSHLLCVLGWAISLISVSLSVK